MGGETYLLARAVSLRARTQWTADPCDCPCDCDPDGSCSGLTECRVCDASEADGHAKDCELAAVLYLSLSLPQVAELSLDCLTCGEWVPRSERACPNCGDGVQPYVRFARGQFP